MKTARVTPETKNSMRETFFFMKMWSKPVRETSMTNRFIK
jgi:hypothetical protein